MSKISKPDVLVLDTNVLVRTLILYFGSKAEHDLSTILQNASIRLALAPIQRDEFWRTAPGIFQDHVLAWEKLATSPKTEAERLLDKVKSCKLLGACGKEAVNAAKELKRALEECSFPTFSWEDFEAYSERQLAGTHHLDEDLILDRARARAERFNPPCSSKNHYQLGDCAVWETIALYLSTGARVWFASADSDFSFDKKKKDLLHPFLQREVRGLRGKLTYFNELADRTRAAGMFGFLKALVSLEPAAEQLKAREALGLFQHLLLRNDFPPSLLRLLEDEEALGFREREILKLRFGFDHGYVYTLEEVGRIFKIPRERVRQIETEALRKLRAMAEALGTND